MGLYWSNFGQKLPLKHVIGGKIKRKKWREDEEEDVSSYRMTLIKREDT